MIAALAKAPELVDSARRSGSNIGFLVADLFAFGGKDVPAAEVEFLDEMLAGTSFDVLAEFFPNFSELDKFEHLGRLRRRCRPRSSAAPRTSSPRSGTAARWPQQLPDAALVECEGAGHMVIFEARDQVNAALEDLVAAASS